MKRVVALSLAVPLCITSCASYKAQSVPISPIEQYATHTDLDEDLQVALVPYDNAEDYKRVFDTKPSYERGYLAVSFFFFNDGSSSFDLDPSGIVAKGEDGSIYQAVPADQVAEQLLRSTTGRYFAGGIIAAGSSKGANEKIRLDFKNKELKAQKIYPQTKLHGILFFPSDAKLASIMVSGIAREGGDAAIPTKEVELTYRYPLVQQYGTR